MKHSFNLNRIAAQVTGDKVAQTTFYHKLINCFKGADVLSKKEAADVIDVIKQESDRAIKLLSRFTGQDNEPAKPVKKAAPKKPAKKKKVTENVA